MTGMTAASPKLLTPEEAASIARCSIKTVRRAYATGALTAYRRRGSRAVLLDNQDVLEWARGSLLQPTVQTTAPLESMSRKPQGRTPSRKFENGVRTAKRRSRQRFDLSANGLRERRTSKTEPPE